MPSFRPNRRGVSLTEVLIVMVVLGILIGLVKIGMDYLGSVFRMGSNIEVEREAHVALYQISRDIRNSSSIVDIQPDKLVLRVFDYRKGFDTADTLFFKNVNIGTITYQFKHAGGKTYLNRRVKFTDFQQDRKILVDAFKEPDADNYIFKPGGGVTAPPYDSVEIVFRVSSPSKWGRNRVYTIEAMKRAFNFT